METQDAIDRRKVQSAKHNPWDNLSQEGKDAQLSLMGCRPVRWTLDLALVNTVSEDGYVYVFAGGPLEGAPNAEPRKRSDGKVDGRSKGARKCGNCGEHGHNARTCGRKRKALTALPESLRKPVATPVATVEASEPVTAAVPSSAAERPETPMPRSTASRKAEKSAVTRGAIKVAGKKTCGKCGKQGHNARTCGKGDKKPAGSTLASQGAKKVTKGPSGGFKPGSGKTGRQNICGKCKKLGHNARTCKG